MTIWITSDTHFCHENIIKNENRPFRNSDEMNDSLIARWNANVKPLDIVYHLGDFGVGKTEELKKVFEKLNGKITLVLGNFDDFFYKLTDFGFSCLANEIMIQYKTFEFRMTHHSLSDLIYDDMSHGIINLHGHVHGKNRVNRNRINVSCDVWDYTPITLDDVMMQYRKQRKSSYDKN